MNKAFIKEVEDRIDRDCPVCGSLGVSVLDQTVDAHLTADDRVQLGQTVYYCPSPTCDVSYFDLHGKFLTASRILDPAFPKNSAAPLCRCFNFTWNDLQADLNDGGVRRVRELLQKSESTAANCTLTMPDGRCCIAEVQKTFLRLRAAK
jgi:hypothetical protein